MLSRREGRRVSMPGQHAYPGCASEGMAPNRCVPGSAAICSSHSAVAATSEEIGSGAAVAYNLFMPAFNHHLFICCNQREPENTRGCCDAEGSAALRTQFKLELAKHDLGPLVRANRSGCLEQCEHGPTVVIYPQGIWYGGVTLQDVPRIVEQTLLKGEVLEDLVIADSCLNNKTCPHILARTSENGQPG